MTIAINYKNSLLKKKVSNLVLFIDEKYNVVEIKKSYFKFRISPYFRFNQIKRSKKKIFIL